MTKKSNSGTDANNKATKGQDNIDTVDIANIANSTDGTGSKPKQTAKQESTSPEPNTVGIRGTTASSTTAKSTNDDGMSDVVFGLIVLAVLIALVVWAVVSVVNTSSTSYTLGELDYPTASRVGDSVSLSYDISSSIAEGANIEWIVDDVSIDNYSYDGSGQLQYQWQPTQSGKHTVQLRVGQFYTDKAVLTIANPLVVVDIDDIVVQYGEDIPQLTYTVSGLLGSDSWLDLGCSGKVQCTEDIDGVGIYTLDMSSTSCASTDYELQCNSGNLIVVPRRVNLSNNIIKQYDGTNSIAVGSLDLVGVLEGDDVEACADTLYFSDKNVGQDKQISTYNIALSGADSDNYTIEGATICGTIVAKTIKVDGVVVDSKVYDGNTSAVITDSGMLSGVCDGDIVAIGYMDARYSTAKIGKNKPIEVDSITLIGSDSGNYTVERPTLSGSIVAKYIDLLTGNDAVAGDSSR